MWQLFSVACALLAVSYYSVITHKLSVPAAIAGGLMGLIIFIAVGYSGLLLLGTFFLLGVLATSWKKGLKKSTENDHQQKRTTGQVLANGGMALLLAFLALMYPASATLLIVLMAASLAAATADTLSSELGMVYGKRFYNILTWKKEPKGLDGVVSLEGTLIGVAGAFIIALVYASAHHSYYILHITIAGAIGNLCDSLLGATLERKKWIGNNLVNFLNTACGALCAWLLY